MFLNHLLIESAVKAVDKAVEPFKNIQELLKSAIFLKQQLKVEETKRRPTTANNQNSSVYKRLSGECGSKAFISDHFFKICVAKSVVCCTKHSKFCIYPLCACAEAIF